MKFLLNQYNDSPSTFITMYQGYPKDLDGQVIKPEWIKIEDDVSRFGNLIASCRGWDFGYTEGGNASVGSKIDVYERNELITAILSDVVICRRDPSAVKDFVVETAIRDGENTIVAVESGGTQIAMAQNIIKHNKLMNHQVRTFIPKAIRGVGGGNLNEKLVNNNKIARSISWILKIEDGQFRLLRGAWNNTVIASMIVYSDTCDEDDIEDSITASWKILFGGV